MKKLLLIIPLFLFACDNSTDSVAQNESQTIYSEGNAAALLEKRPAGNTPFCHFELMSANAERQIGNKSYVYVLPVTYKTDNSAKILTDNLLHSAQVLNKTADTLRSQFPYIAYSWETGYGGVNRTDAWCYVSQRLLPNDTQAIKNWMLTTAKAYHSQGMKIDSSRNPATIFKIAWSSTELAKK